MWYGKRQKSSSTNGQAIKALSPPPSLMTIDFFVLQKNIFSLMARGLYPRPLLMAWPLVEELFFRLSLIYKNKDIPTPICHVIMSRSL